MTLDELAATLPNGFRDAELDSLHLDYANRVATLAMSFCISDPASDEPDEYRRAAVTLHGLQFCVLDPPDGRRNYSRPEPLWVDLVARPGRPGLPQDLPPRTFTATLFVSQWNACVYLAALHTTFAWVE